MSVIFEDLESRPGSNTSLLRSTLGVCVAENSDEWLPAASLVELMEAPGVPGARTRTAITRVKAKGWLVSESRGRIAGYAVAKSAIAGLPRGDRRIFHPQFMAENGDRWCLISFSVPEEDRNLRHQLRRYLSAMGCGNVQPALWICPPYLTSEVEDVVAELALVGRVTTFITEEIRGANQPSVAIATWWDLDAIAELHRRFLHQQRGAVAAYNADPTPANAFRIWVRALDSWRVIPYADPGLAPSLLPRDWPGYESIALYASLRSIVLAPATEYASQVVRAHAGDAANDQRPSRA